MIQDFLPGIFCIHEQFLSGGFNQSETDMYGGKGERDGGGGGIKLRNFKTIISTIFFDAGKYFSLQNNSLTHIHQEW